MLAHRVEHVRAAPYAKRSLVRLPVAIGAEKSFAGAAMPSTEWARHWRRALHPIDASAAQLRHEDDYLVYNYNRFQACRFGLEGTIVDPKTNESRSLREDILASLRRLEPHAAALASQAALDDLYAAATSGGNDATFLRREFASEGSVSGMVDAAVHRFRGQ